MLTLKFLFLLELKKLTSINDEMVIDAPKIEEVLPKFMEFCKDAVMVAHNSDFDMSFIEANYKRQNLECDYTVLIQLQCQDIL